MAEQVLVPDAEPIHEYFGLSYANYLVIPRTILQSMPVDWQQRFIALLDEAAETAEKHNAQWPPDGLSIHVELVPFGQEPEPTITDPLADYLRGRRRLWHNETAGPERT